MEAVFPTLLVKAFLILGRVGGVLTGTPALSGQALPVQGRVLLALCLVCLLYPVIPFSPSGPPPTFADLLVLFAGELAVGLLIGLAFGLAFGGIQYAGEVMGFQIGFSMAQSLDPLTEAQSMVVTVFWNYLAIVIFLVMDGHHIVLRLFVESYRILPVGGLHLRQVLIDALIRDSAQMFIIGIQLAAPVMVAMILVDVAVGFMGRAAPALNIMVVGFPIKILVGLTMLGIALYAFPAFMERLVRWAVEEANRFLLLAR